MMCIEIHRFNIWIYSFNVLIQGLNALKFSVFFRFRSWAYKVDGCKPVLQANQGSYQSVPEVNGQAENEDLHEQVEEEGGDDDETDPGVNASLRCTSVGEITTCQF